MQTDTSKFAMWRACIAVMHLDGEISAHERDWMRDKIDNLPLSLDQKMTLINDLRGGACLDSLIPFITDGNDRAFLLHLMRIISHLDGDFSDHEKEAFSRLEKLVLSRLNLEKISEQAQKFEDESYENVEMDNRNSLFEAAFGNIVRFLSNR